MKHRFITISAFLLLICFPAIKVFAADYYWVNGTGNWSDLNHWAQNSGGSVLHINVPGPLDNVIIDDNSFPSNGTVNITAENATCHDLTFINSNAEITISTTPNVALRIFGSLTFSDKVINGISGPVEFRAEESTTIFTAGKAFLSSIFFLGENGEWNLNSDIETTGSIYHTFGTIITNNFSVNCGTFSSVNTHLRTLDLGASQVNTGTWEITTENLTLKADQSHIIAANRVSTANGPQVFYNNVTVLGNIGVVYQQESKASYNKVEFLGDQSIIEGACFADTLIFHKSGSIINIDTIQYSYVGKTGKLTGEENASFIKWITVDSTTIINGACFIDSAFLNYKATIKGANSLNFCEVKNRAVFNGQNTGHFIHLKNNASFISNNTIDTLLLTEGYRYRYYSGSNTSVSQYLDLPGTCIDPITFKTDTNGLVANLSLPSGSTGQYVSCRDINVSSGNLALNESIDLGNNTGVSFVQPAPRVLYWRAGDGDWNDPERWSLSMGGSGGNCPPTAIDDVYFVGGVHEISITQTEAVCHDMNCDAYNLMGSISGGDSTSLHIYGSLVLSESSGIDIEGGIFMESEDSEVIISNEKEIGSKVKFNGIGGSWALQDDYKCNDTTFLIYGSIISNGFEITTNYFNTDTKFDRLLDIRNSNFNLMGDGIGWYLQDENLSLLATGSHIYLKGSNSFTNEGTQRLHFYKLTGQKPQNLCRSNGSYSIFHTMHFSGEFSKIEGGFKSDSTVFRGALSEVNGVTDTLTVTLFYHQQCKYTGGSNVSEFVKFFSTGKVEGFNSIDTCIIMDQGVIEQNNIIDTCFISQNSTIQGSNRIDKAVLRGNSNIIGTNIFGDLYLTPKKEYYFENDKIQRIDRKLFCQGFCSSYILLHSDSTGGQANLLIENNDVSGNYLILRDINVSGGNSYLAENSIDMGNNTGWIIPPPAGEAKYWVGGTGMWSDSTHWANTSGGQGGVCLPTAYDDVFFDNNSFPTGSGSASIDVSTAFCRNMTWSANNNLSEFIAVDTNTMMIHGSLQLCDSMVWDLKCPVWFKSELRGSNINTLNKYFLDETYFIGEQGEWTIQSEFTSIDSVTLISGNLKFTDTITCLKFTSTTTLPRQLHFENQTLKVNYWDITAQNMEIFAENSTIESQYMVSTIDGDNIQYNDIEFVGAQGTLLSDNNASKYRKVSFAYDGIIYGPATIDSVICDREIKIFGNDTISYIISGEEMNILSEQSLISFAENLSMGATIEGSNIIDTCLVNSSASIQGSNIFDTCSIHHNAMIFGTNSFNRALIIGGNAYIYEENNFGFAWIKGDGNIGGANEFDHLRFSPGRTYKVETGDTQYIHNQFDIRGNNCFPITFQSTVPGDEGFISIPGGTVEGDYIEMRDVHGLGGATYYAGGHSTNHDNNAGWNFENAPGYIYGLMPDTSICPGTTLYINTDNFNGDDSTTFSWQDGTVGPVYTATETEDVIVTVHYADNCIVDDTIRVTVFPEFQMEILTSSDVCEGDTIFASTDILNPVYQWPDGSSNNFYIAETGGMITGIAIDENNCPVFDTAFVEVKPSPYVYLGEDIVLENGETITLDAGDDGTEYIWSTGETSRIIEVSEESQYWVTVFKDGCTAMDTIFIGEYMIGIPSAFSPNGDGENETLGILGTGFELIDFVIVSRQGQTVFRTSDPDQHWDGTYNGKEQEMGVYMYMIRFKTKSSESRIMKWNITLLR
ncbi:MAG: hypothetical protein C0593_14220 [Marinilabiliales bacterium]|nr:MAG: hypothetical protein C0593_14220 [Marinilabiliales bacterium]